MSQGIQSPGGSATSGSAAQSGFDANDAADRLGLAIRCAIDVALLAIELQAMANRLYRSNGDHTALAAGILVTRVDKLSNAICSALDDLRHSPTDLRAELFGAPDVDEVERFRGELAEALVGAFSGPAT